MNRLLLAICLICAPAGLTSCATTPTAQVAQVRTLAAIGTTAKAGMDACTQLLKAGKLSVAEWQHVANYYDTFQKTFGVAISAAHGADINAILASPDLLELAGNFTSLVATYTNRK